MQSLMARSDENGGVDCLGFFDGTVTRFPKNHSDTDGTKLKVPHMGWNQVAQSQNHPLWDGIADNAYFYFVHSFFLPEVDLITWRDPSTMASRACSRRQRQRVCYSVSP